MNKKRLVWLVLLLVTIVVVGVLLWFFSPGVHVLGPFLRMDVDTPVYFFTGGSKGVYTGESTVFRGDFTVMDRWWDDVIEGENWAFQGSMEVQGYELAYDAQWCHGPNGWGYRGKDGRWDVHYDANWMVSNAVGDVEFLRSPNYYWLQFYGDDPEAMVIYIFREEGASLIAVPADSPEEAKEKLERFHNQLYEDLFGDKQ